MGQAGAKLRRTIGGMAHWCPACTEMHHYALDAPLANGARWTWDGNLALPTFRPSMNISVAGDAAEGIAPERCHYTLTAGVIQFHGDCTHELRGQAVPLPDLPSHLCDPL